MSNYFPKLKLFADMMFALQQWWRQQEITIITLQKEILVFFTVININSSGDIYEDMTAQNVSSQGSDSGTQIPNMWLLDILHTELISITSDA